MIPTTDICDANEDKIAAGTLRVVAPIFKSWGKSTQFMGQAHTLKVFEDNSLVRSALEKDGRGKVLVVDGGGSTRCALVGGNLGLLADKNNWAGIVVYGCVRDTLELNSCQVGIRALAAHPMKSQKRGVGHENIDVALDFTVVRPGDWVYVDEDGVLISDTNLI
ncbi:regulator of ribonuclease activity A [Limnobacter thiooxidans]|uniref:4-hydroxy-4-methyl-2-oxoglutarate aldolase n=1 Tax=Limnobacter thiooxidans TaxID=131080 RepID=A0AA86J678_9BURK|nr:ribonuclease E activity regulator RraA [Limnobacter sp.]MCZ8015886.1 ribonuclease E activity regulator RraA [Limnobacter sp.]RZS42968.1 regulator of ribonuclease activity A [Limnobacter thiooxidans]BET25595.1 ribonuclease E activity regulator RraA [Limnobacter thiooxidans]